MRVGGQRTMKETDLLDEHLKNKAKQHTLKGGLK